MNGEPNQYTKEELKRMHEIVDSLGEISSIVYKKYRMDEPHGDHIGNTVMALRHMKALLTQMMWHINNPAIPDDGYTREKIIKLIGELEFSSSSLAMIREELQ